MVLVALVGAIALLAGGCNGGTARAAAASSCRGPGVTDKTIKLGLMYPVSGGDQSIFTPYRSGVEARLALANAQGGVHGRTLISSWADDQGQEDSNLGAAQQLVRIDKVFGIMELSTASNGGAQWLNRQNIPVTGTALDLAWSKYKNMFSYSNFVTPNGVPSTWGEYARDDGATRAAVLYSDGAEVTKVLASKFADSLRAAGIPSDLIEASVENKNEAAVAQRILANHDDLITGLDDTEMTLTIGVIARQTDPSIRILSGTAYDPAVLQQGGAALAGTSVFVEYRPFELRVPGHKVFLDAMTKYAPQQQPAANEIALQGWLGADLMLRGLEAAGACPTRQSFITNLRGVTGYTAGGLLPFPVDMRESFGKQTDCYYFLKINQAGNAFVPVSNQPRCGREVQQRTAAAVPK